MTRQRGFLPITGYVGLALLAVIIGLLLALKIQSARLDAKEAELEACTTRYAETLKLVAKQNQAVKDLEIAAKNRQNRTAIALKQAQERQGSLKSEIARLQASMGSGKTCAEAVADVRKGLR